MVLKFWWFIRGTLKEIGYILVLLGISYLSIIINVFILYGMNGGKIMDTIKRQDILNMSLTIGISMLAGILLIEWMKESSKVVTVIPIFITGIFALILSVILTIQTEMGKNFFDNNLIYYTTVLLFLLTLIIVFISNYSSKKVKKFIEIQKQAKESRDKENFKIDDKEYKI